MKKFFQDFKAFAMKGNIVDMAIGVVIGGAFSKIVSSLVKDIITPLISMATGEVVLTDLKWVLRPEVTEMVEDIETVITAEVAITYGVFIQAVIDFLIIALSIFIVMRVAMKAHEKLEALKKKEVEEVAEEPTPEQPAVTELSLLTEIRDLLQKDKE